MRLSRVIISCLGLATGLLVAAENDTLAHAPDPRKLDDPESLRKTVPALAALRDWKEFATPAQIALYDGPETVYPEIPASAFDLTGFDSSLLGSAVPAPGVHPRILFSPGDIPLLKRRLENSKTGRKALIETRFLLAQTLYNSDPTREKSTPNSSPVTPQT
jgi:hypothetical protein